MVHGAGSMEQGAWSKGQENTNARSNPLAPRPLPPAPKSPGHSSLAPRPLPPAPKSYGHSSFAPCPSLSVGSTVVHERFGRGTVLALEGKDIDAKATVRFENAGTKVLLLRFAKLTLG